MLAERLVQTADHDGGAVSSRKFLVGCRGAVGIGIGVALSLVALVWAMSKVVHGSEAPNRLAYDPLLSQHEGVVAPEPLELLGEDDRCYTHKINGNLVFQEPTIEQYDEYPPFKSHGGLHYISGSKTVDILRYETGLPFCTHFTDSSNHVHDVCIKDRFCQFSMVMPVQWDIQWHGEVFDRTGFDALVAVAFIEFSFKPAMFLHTFPGIRVRCMGYGAGDTRIVGESPFVDDIVQVATHLI